MQLTQETKKVVRSGQFAESKFKIEASSKAFQILSSRLYADEYKAVVRELCTNASDAHAAAGKSDTPIVVHAPDYLDNSFSVRDYGKGIDPEEFEKIYTTYFYSTKSESNEEVGCFGLGSKSPFAYAKQFTVENHYQGNKYIYSCFINETSEPSVTLLTTFPTTESGVKVSFPVNRDHWSRFHAACKDVLQWFTTTPVCNTQIENNSFRK
jgi:DNA topoisomerase VI subunit B